MSTDIRVAVVGAGAMGADHVERIARRTSGATVAAIVEPDAGRAAAAQHLAPGARVVTRVEDVLETGEVDAVLVATPGKFHEPVLMPVLDAGLPVLCEKPLAPDAASSERILAREQELEHPLIQVGFMRRFDRGYRDLRSAVEAGESGELLILHCVHRNPEVPDSYTREMLVADSLVHEFDIVPWVAGSSLKSIEIRQPRASRHSATLREPILALLELENGVLADVELNVNARFGYQVATEAVFESGVARIGQPDGLQQWRDGELRIADHRSFATRFAAAYDAQVQTWIDAVRRGDRIDGPNAWDGYLVALACEAGAIALEGGGRVEIPTPARPSFYA